MEFNDYLAGQLGEYCNDLTQKQRLELEKLYGQLMIWQISEQNVGNDKESQEKVHEHVVYASNRLASYMEEIKLGFGIEESQDKARRGM